MFLLIAQVTAPSPTTELPGGSPIGGLFGGGAGMEIAIVLGVAMFLVLIFAFWATFIRKPKKAYLSGATSATQISGRSQSRRMSKEKERGSSIDEDLEDNESSNEVRKRRRKRRRPHRQRMPSLAEAGGLPPIKESMEQNQSSPSNQPFNGGSADSI